MRVPVLGVEFDNVNMEEAAERCMELMHSPGFHYMVTPNPEIVWECRKDAELREIINGADVVINFIKCITDFCININTFFIQCNFNILYVAVRNP